MNINTMGGNMNNVIINGFAVSMMLVTIISVILIIASYSKRRYEKARLERILEAMDKDGASDYIHLIQFK